MGRMGGLALALWALAALPATAQPAARSVTPRTVAPYAPVTLRIAGSGFLPGCRVMLDRGLRFAPVATTVLGEDAIEVRLPAGLPPRPAVRRLVVDCGGARSRPLTLHVSKSRPAAGTPPAAPTAPEQKEAPPVQDTPVLQALDPAEVPAGEPFTLTLTGSGFEEGAVVQVLANVHAGSSAAPEYRPRRFPAERLSDSVLLVDFERGFAPEPALRPVTVVNPSGAASAPLFLRITRRSP